MTKTDGRGVDRDEHRRRRRPGIRRAVRADAAARAGRHGDGPRRRLRLRLSGRLLAGAQDGRPDLDAHGDRLYLRRDSDVPADGSIRHQFRHEPRTVPRRQRLRRPFARRAGHCDGRGLRRLCRDLRLVGGDGRDVFRRRLSGDAPLRLSAILRHRRDRGRRHAGRHAAAVDRARGLRHHHRAGHRQAVHRRHHSRPARDRHVHADHRADRLVSAGLPADRSANHMARAVCRPEEYLGAGAAVRVRHRRALRLAVPAALHPDRSRRRRRHRRVPDRRAHRAAEQGEDPQLAAAGDPHRRGGLYDPDRRADLRLFSHGDADPAKGHGTSHRPRPRALRRPRPHHGDVSGAGLPDGRDGHDHPDGADHLSRSSSISASTRSGSASSS